MAAVLAAATAAGGWYFLRDVSLDQVVEAIRELGPVPYFSALAVLPAVGAPVSPFYLGAGVFGREVAIIGSLSAVAINIALTYVLARWLLHPVIERLMTRFGRKVPVVRREDRWMVTFLLRVTPGPPFFVQSYLLGLAGIPFWSYWLVSTAVAWTFALGVILVGDSLFSGRSGQLVLSVVLIAVVIVGVRLVRKMLRRRAPQTVIAAADETLAATTPPEG